MGYLRFFEQNSAKNHQIAPVQNEYDVLYYSALDGNVYLIHRQIHSSKCTACRREHRLHAEMLYLFPMYRLRKQR